MAEKFIQKAIKHPGALTAAAKAAGMTVRGYALKHEHGGNVAGSRSRFYLQVLSKVSHKRKKS